MTVVTSQDQRAASVQQAFELFERNVIRIPESEDRAAMEVHPKIREHMRRGLGSLLIEDYLSGSYSRRVQVAPRLRDIDIILTLADPHGVFAASATAALRTVDEVAQRCDLVRDTEIRCRSVRALLHDYEFPVDLVVARPHPAGGVYLARRVPEEGLDDWSYGNPKGQKVAAFRKNDACGSMYIPEVRIVKFWKNGACERVFKSYHAESILFHALEERIPYADATLAFFDAAYESLAPGVLTEDPGAPGFYVDERLEPEERSAARHAVAIARRDAYAARGAATLEEELEAWARVFGPAFPAPSTSRDALASSVVNRTAGVTGLGVTANRGQRTVQPRSWRVTP